MAKLFARKHVVNSLIPFRASVAGLALLLTAFIATASAAAQQVPDIVGLRFGMTDAEATSVLLKHDPTITVLRVDSAYGYSDGVKTYQTPTFLSRLEGRRRGTHSSSLPEFTLYFTPAPAAPTLWLVERREKITQAPPALDQYRTALFQKYGKPVAVTEGWHMWNFPVAAPNCLNSAPGSAKTYFDPRIADNLETITRFSQQKRWAPADLRQCAQSLFVAVGTSDGTLVNSQRFLMIDVPRIITARAAADKWVGEMEAKVNAARRGQAKTPAF